MEEISIINTGGTFNKQYNEKTGYLEIPHNCDTIKEIVEKCFRNNLLLNIEGLLYKDSLDLNDNDRKIISEKIKNNNKTLLVHGTDTMDITAKYLDDELKNNTIVLTGAMSPYSIDKIEAVSNFSTALHFLTTTSQKGVFIAMHGLVKPYQEIKKNKQLGIFQCQM